MSLVTVEELAARVRCIADPVLHGKVSKALSVLQRTLALYRRASVTNFRDNA